MCLDCHSAIVRWFTYTSECVRMRMCRLCDVSLSAVCAMHAKHIDPLLIIYFVLYLIAASPCLARCSSHTCLSPPPQDGTTPLIMAAQNGHVETVRLLLEHRANLNSQTTVSR